MFLAPLGELYKRVGGSGGGGGGGGGGGNVCVCVCVASAELPKVYRACLSISTTLIVLIFARTNFRAEHRFARNCAEISITDFLKLVAGARKC